MNSNSDKRVGVIDFQNTPLFAVVEYLTQISGRPIIVSLNLTGKLTYRSAHDMTFAEAVRELTGVLASNNLALVDVDSRYFKLTPASQTNSLPESPHLEVRVEKDQFLIEDHPVSREQFAAEVKKRATADTEIWIYDAQTSTNADFNTAYLLIAETGAKSRKIFQVFLPRR
jgi:type II secretory pathway component GspD/PulD (secretin)